MFTLKLEPIINLGDEQFKQLCSNNPDVKLERTSSGDLVVMSPTGGESGIRNSLLIARLVVWAETDNTGVVFDSSTMFQLPNGAFRSPDAAWITKSRWEQLSDAERKTFSPICPDFVVELRSESDTLKSLQDKMSEYKDNGVRLGWLIDPIKKQVEITQIGQPKEVLSNPSQLSGEEILPGFILFLKGII
jgi:Uma2 family endonuclease